MSFELRRTNAEMWIAQRLGGRETYAEVFSGDTTFETRRERVRKIILDRNLEHVQAGLRNGHSETWGELFRRFYGQRLGKQTQPAQTLELCFNGEARA